ncbi:unnamed protein product [Meloidogyne enterolobii]|uniref:MARVEL domain-containing protein n=6 Tax=Meloidogyne TaxID=189290 RepID=A0A914M8E2_MELIC|nr:unnamed protein product [Meloidogyne enterolobii]
MATTVTTRTVTTRTVAGTGPRIRMIPIWSIKLISAIIGLVVLVLIFILRNSIWQWYVNTFIVLVLTCGFLLGWALPPVLNRFLTFYRSDMITHSIIAGLSVLSLILCVLFLFSNERYSRTEDYKIMVGITICMTVEAIVCCILVSWICFGNYAIVETR